MPFASRQGFPHSTSCKCMVHNMSCFKFRTKDIHEMSPFLSKTATVMLHSPAFPKLRHCKRPSPSDFSESGNETSHPSDMFGGLTGLRVAGLRPSGPRAHRPTGSPRAHGPAPFGIHTHALTCKGVYACKHACTYLCTYVCTYVRTYVCMHVCMYVCVCVYVCMYVRT